MYDEKKYHSQKVTYLTTQTICTVLADSQAMIIQIIVII